MLPEVRPHVSTALADQLEHQLDLAPHLEAGQLDVEGVAGIAVVAAAHMGRSGWTASLPRRLDGHLTVHCSRLLEQRRRACGTRTGRARNN